jgi:DNA-binding response OmpR family regulator
VRILVVDDDRHLALAVKRGLEAEGFAVDVAADGADGFWLATENPMGAPKNKSVELSYTRITLAVVAQRGEPAQVGQAHHREPRASERCSPLFLACCDNRPSTP